MKVVICVDDVHPETGWGLLDDPAMIWMGELYKKYGAKLEVVGFPANNFGKQEPGSNDEIAEFCEANYGVSFTMAAKVSVKGDDIHPIFKWLINQKNKSFTGDIKWNFEKFLLDEDGQLIERYRSTVKPLSEKITKHINK